MKTVRLITLVIVLALAFSVWGPAPVLAKSADPSQALAGDFAKSSMVKLTISNRTGGTLYISLTGPKGNYWFAASKQGKSNFQILPGKYTYTITASNCGGHLTKTRNFKGSASLGQIVCNRYR
jgi:hypothetical protein